MIISFKVHNREKAYNFNPIKIQEEKHLGMEETKFKTRMTEEFNLD